MREINTNIPLQQFGVIENNALNNAKDNVTNTNMRESITQSRKEFENIGKRDMEIALEESMKTNEELEVKKAIEFSIDAFME